MRHSPNQTQRPHQRPTNSVQKILSTIHQSKLGPIRTWAWSFTLFSQRSCFCFPMPKNSIVGQTSANKFLWCSTGTVTTLAGSFQEIYFDDEYFCEPVEKLWLYRNCGLCRWFVSNTECERFGFYGFLWSFFGAWYDY